MADNLVDHPQPDEPKQEVIQRWQEFKDEKACSKCGREVQYNELVCKQCAIKATPAGYAPKPLRKLGVDERQESLFEGHSGTYCD
jgi:predicted amidophosphoribosyltransferase